MYMGHTFCSVVAILLVLVFINRNEAYICRPCHLEICGDDLSICQYGTVDKVCGCCQECGKGPGERCGGDMYYIGTCGTGLRCQYRPKDIPDEDGNGYGECVPDVGDE